MLLGIRIRHGPLLLLQLRLQLLLQLPLLSLGCVARQRLLLHLL
jgi:hypothetical protein